MIFTDEEKQNMVAVFKAVHSLKEDAKNLVSSANDNLAVLAERLDKEHTKQSKKVMRKAIKRRYSDWVAQTKNEAQHIEIADEIAMVMQKE